MTKVRKVCPWECSGSKGEIDVVRAERSRVPNVPGTTALMRCGECQGISMATLVTVPSGFDNTRDVECRTPLGRFETSGWVPAALHVRRLIIEPKSPPKFRGHGRW